MVESPGPLGVQERRDLDAAVSGGTTFARVFGERV